MCPGENAQQLPAACHNPFSSMETNLGFTPVMIQAVVGLVLALVLGAAIGFERQIRKQPAGLHTNALVCMGSAAYVLVALLVTQDSSPTRIAAQVVSGVGFICAGVIWHEGATTRGLNTAATIWCTAAVGVLAGLNFPLLAVVAAALLLAANITLHWVVHHYFDDVPAQK
jgi:putative Mg2+ transporter-C (MgtC) family protein